MTRKNQPYVSPRDKARKDALQRLLRTAQFADGTLRAVRDSLKYDQAEPWQLEQLWSTARQIQWDVEDALTASGVPLPGDMVLETKPARPEPPVKRGWPKYEPGESYPTPIRDLVKGWFTTTFKSKES